MLIKHTVALVSEDFCGRQNDSSGKARREERSFFYHLSRRLNLPLSKLDNDDEEIIPIHS